MVENSLFTMKIRRSISCNGRYNEQNIRREPKKRATTFIVPPMLKSFFISMKRWCRMPKIYRRRVCFVLWDVPKHFFAARTDLESNPCITHKSKEFCIMSEMKALLQLDHDLMEFGYVEHIYTSISSAPPISLQRHHVVEPGHYLIALLPHFT